MTPEQREQRVAEIRERAAMAGVSMSLVQYGCQHAREDVLLLLSELASLAEVQAKEKAEYDLHIGWAQQAGVEVGRLTGSTMIERVIDAEQARWQRAIDKTVYAMDPDRDGSGVDSGDPLDLTLHELEAAWAKVQERMAALAERASRAEEDLRSQCAEWERLTGELNKAIHPDGDGPERPSMCDLIAYISDDYERVRVATAHLWHWDFGSGTDRDILIAYEMLVNKLPLEKAKAAALAALSRGEQGGEERK